MTGKSTELFLYRVSKVTAGIEKYCGATFKQNQTDRQGQQGQSSVVKNRGKADGIIDEKDTIVYQLDDKTDKFQPIG